MIAAIDAAGAVAIDGMAETVPVGVRIAEPVAEAAGPVAVEPERRRPIALSAFAMIDLLLRDRPGMLAHIRRGHDLPAILRTMVATIGVAMAIVGAALGSYRGGIQVVFDAIKLPIVLIGTAALSAPALSAIGAALGRPAKLAADLALLMSALAFGALLLVAGTPLLLVGRAIALTYAEMALAMVAVFAIAGLAALRMVCRGVALEAAPGWRTAVAGLCVVFSLVGGQLSWALRPYLVRPGELDVPFVRDVEGGLVDAVTTALGSLVELEDDRAAPREDRR